jgi:hypothetical protein
MFTSGASGNSLLMNRIRRYILPTLGVAALAACTSSVAPLVDAETTTAPSPTSASAKRADGRQQLQGHLSAAMNAAPIVERVPAATPLTLTLGLSVKDLRGILDAADRVSDPRSSSYRKYVTPEEFAPAGQQGSSRGKNR